MSSTKQLISAIQKKDNEKVFELSEILDIGEINKVVGGKTALHAACDRHNDKQTNDQALDKLLNTAGIDVNIKDDGGWTPLHAAVVFNNVYAVSKLLASPGIKVNSTTTFGTTPVTFAVRNCHMEVLKMMLKDPCVYLDIKDKDGNGLEEMVGCRGGGGQDKEECLKMISNEKMKRKSGAMGQQPIQDGGIGRRIEKVDRLNEKIGDEEEKMKRNVEISKQKKKNLKRQQTLETKKMSMKRKEEETQLAKKYKEEEKQLVKKHKEEDTQLEVTIKSEAEANQRYIGLLREQREEQIRDIEMTRIDPAKDASEDRHKLEAALNIQEAAKRALECPVCFQLMRHPTKIWMCEFSHLICEACKDKLKESDLLGGGKCPTCTTQPITLRAHKSEEFASIIFN